MSRKRQRLPRFCGSIYESAFNEAYPDGGNTCGILGSELLSVQTCHSGIEQFKENVANTLAENFRPIGYVCVSVGGVQLMLFIMALLQICWCCGASDPVDDWDDDYDEYGRVAY